MMELGQNGIPSRVEGDLEASAPRSPEVYAQAAEICGIIDQVVELYRLATQHFISSTDSDHTTAKQLMRQAASISESAILNSYQAGIVNQDPEFQVSTVIDGEPIIFIATQLRRLDRNGAEFYNRHTRGWLSLNDHAFTVSPPAFQ